MPSRYVGLLGPKRMREKLLASLPEHGFVLSHISLAHLCNPAGPIVVVLEPNDDGCGRANLRVAPMPAHLERQRLSALLF